MEFNFNGKKVLVTGAGRGIGKEIAIALAKAGAVVYGLDKEQALLDALVRVKSNIRPILADLTDWEATRAALEKLEPMDGLVNNAGVGKFEPALTTSKKLLDWTFSINTFAPINVTQAIGKKMVEAGKGGSIVNMSSILALNPGSNAMAYCMSKAAVDMMTKQFALELGPHKIRVNAVNPTFVRTDLSEPFFNNPVMPGVVQSHTPLDRFPEKSEIVGPVLYLLSDLSSMVTGTMNRVDGGLLCNISV